MEYRSQTHHNNKILSYNSSGTVHEAIQTHCPHHGKKYSEPYEHNQTNISLLNSIIQGA